jgi:hypothetical protein
MAKRVKIKDQIYNGAFTNAKLAPKSRNALLGAGFMIVLSFVISKNI